MRRNTPLSPVARKLKKAGIGAFFRPGELAVVDIDTRGLQRLMDDGVVEQVSRGLYRLTEAEPTVNYTLASVCARVPGAVVCLLSALKVYGIGTHVPAEVWIAIPNKARVPRIATARVRVVRFSGAAWNVGVVETAFEGVPTHITTPARTLVDCFRYERLIGREAAREALRDALERRQVTMDALYNTLDVLPSRRLRNVLEASLL